MKSNSVGDALALKLTSFHCPTYDTWHGTRCLTNIDSIQEDTVNVSKPTFIIDTKLTKHNIINHSKYAKLFSGIGHFHCKLEHITVKENDMPVQKPPCKVPLAMRD